MLPLSKHTVVSITENTRVMLFREIVAVYCENHMRYTNTFCEQNEGFFDSIWGSDGNDYEELCLLGYNAV
jgi:hypothetical protein